MSPPPSSATSAARRHDRPPVAVRPRPQAGTRSAGSAWLWLAPPPRARHSAGWALLPLRAFLGITFCFAGLQKLANPAFFRASSPASIQAQLAGAARRSPIHGLITPLVHVAVPLGLLIALAELAVGLGTLAGLLSRVAAVGGLLISLSLFLTVSFHTNPYYTGSDIVFAFAWLPFIVAGAGPLSADAVLHNLARRGLDLSPEAVVPVPFSSVQAVCGSYQAGACSARRGQPCEPGPCPYLGRPDVAPPGRKGAELGRRTVVLKGAAAGALGAAGLVGAGLIAGVARLLGGGSSSPAAHSLSAGGAAGAPPTSTRSTTTSPSSTSGQRSTSASGSSSGGSHPAGTKLGPASTVPVGGAASFQDPASGDPALVVQPSRGTFLAFDAVCPHAGCTVEYSSSDHLFICPCHGSQFNGRTGAVEVGPAQSGLTPISIAEGSDGQLYAR
jgi:thiosulfate dehydrogenase [quinone] large subunit